MVHCTHCGHWGVGSTAYDALTDAKNRNVAKQIFLLNLLNMIISIKEGFGKMPRLKNKQSKTELT